MISPTPIPFTAALAAARSRGLLPVTEDTGADELTPEELQALTPEPDF